MSGIRKGERLGAASQDNDARQDESLLRTTLGLQDPDAPVKLPIALIRRDGGTQMRAQLDPDTIQEYADDMARGNQFPPGVVFDNGSEYWLARGFTRTAAAERLGWKEFDYVVKKGTQRDAILFSVGENADHGLRRTNADKRRAVLTLLNDPEWSQLSSEMIADYCRVSHTFVNNIRPSLATVASQGKQENKTRVGADGRQYRVDRLQKAAQERSKKKPTPTPAPPSEPAYNSDKSEPAGEWTDRPAQPRGIYGPGTPSRPTSPQIQRAVIGHLEAAAAGLEQLGMVDHANSLLDYVRERKEEWNL